METMNSDLESYAKISSAFPRGALRLWSAIATSLRLQIALVNFHGIEKNKIPADLLQLRVGTALSSISPPEFDAYCAVTALSQLVYATALFDSYITDTTRFLLIRDPLKLGIRSPVSWETFLNTRARVPTITEAVTRRAREVAFWPFLRRIEYLNKTFGAGIVLADDQRTKLEHFVSIRNAIVHDHAMFEPIMQGSGELVAQQRRAIHHEFNEDEIEIAIKTFSAIARSIFVGVCERVLNVGSDIAYIEYRERLFPEFRDLRGLSKEPSSSSGDAIADPKGDASAR